MTSRKKIYAFLLSDPSIPWMQTTLFYRDCRWGWRGDLHWNVIHWFRFSPFLKTKVNLKGQEIFRHVIRSQQVISEFSFYCHFSSFLFSSHIVLYDHKLPQKLLEYLNLHTWESCLEKNFNIKYNQWKLRSLS